MLTAGLLVMLLVPGAVLAGRRLLGNRALVRVLRGADAGTARDVAILRSIRFAVRTDRIVDAYLATGDMVERARLESLYAAITGEGIERRIGDRADQGPELPLCGNPRQAALSAQRALQS